MFPYFWYLYFINKTKNARIGLVNRVGYTGTCYGNRLRLFWTFSSSAIFFYYYCWIEGYVTDPLSLLSYVFFFYVFLSLYFILRICSEYMRLIHLSECKFHLVYFLQHYNCLSMPKPQAIQRRAKVQCGHL